MLQLFHVGLVTLSLMSHERGPTLVHYLYFEQWGESLSI